MALLLFSTLSHALGSLDLGRTDFMSKYDKSPIGIATRPEGLILAVFEVFEKLQIGMKIT